MTLLRAHTHLLSNPARHYSIVSIASSSRSVVRYRRAFRSCAASVDGGGRFEDSRDGSLLAASGCGATPYQSRAAPAPAIVESSPGSGAPSGVPAWVTRAESRIERAIFDFRFLTLMAVCGSLVGSLLCFLKGCGYVCESFIAYYGMCLSGEHTGKVILRLVEAVDVYLVGTVMLIFGMGLYGLFISNCPEASGGATDRALKNTTLFGMFRLTARPLWMRITTLDTLKTKLGHVIVMILLVKLFERSKTVQISSSLDLLCYSVSILLSSASLYVLHRLHAP